MHHVIKGWDEASPEADGDVVTLYDAIDVETNKHHGDPIADVFAIVARPNNAILALADGCNWGPKPLKAARCAILGCTEYLSDRLFREDTMPSNTQALMKLIRESFDAAQDRIIQYDGATTTLSVAVACEMEAPIHNKTWALCVVSVGDSPCLVWKHKKKIVEEVTSVTEEGKERDLRDCGGCLGANVGTQPDLSNLMCYFVPVAENDVVFLVSDGVFDNFDPVILLKGTTECEKQRKSEGGALADLPVLSRKQREEVQLQLVAEHLRKVKSENGNSLLDASIVTKALMQYVMDITNTKRNYLEHGCIDIDSNSELSAHAKAKKKAEVLNFLPGKLDHASIVAYKIGVPHQDCHPEQDVDLSSVSVAFTHSDIEIDGFLSVNLGPSKKAS